MKVGDRLGRFELVGSLGKGSHGVVFEARDTMLGERIAIKALHPWLSNDETLRERFKRELILTRRVSHPGVCRLYDLHEEGETLFISMQFVEGRTLSQVIKTEAIDDKRCVALMRGICGPLAAAHEAGVTHRDLKPGNVLVGDNDRVVVLDFGIATAAGVGQLTTPGQALGSVPFIPPEVWEGGSASALGDQYALGVIAFASLTRELPYTGKNPLEIVDAIRASTPSLRARAPSVGEALERVILRAIAVKPEDRFANVAALDAAFAAAIAENAPSSASSGSSAAPQELTADDVDPLTSASSVIELQPLVASSSTGAGARPETASTVPASVVPEAVLSGDDGMTPAAPRSLLVSALSPVLRSADDVRPPEPPEQGAVTRPMRPPPLGVFADTTAPSPFVPPSAVGPATSAPANERDDFEQRTAPLSAADLGLPVLNADDLMRSYVSAEGFDDGPAASVPPSSPPAREETRGFAPAPSSASSSMLAPEETRGFAPAPSSTTTGPEGSDIDPPSAPTGPAPAEPPAARPAARNDATVIVRVRDVDAALAANGGARGGKRVAVFAAVVGVAAIALVGVAVSRGGGDVTVDSVVVAVDGVVVADAGQATEPAIVDAGVVAPVEALVDAGAVAVVSIGADEKASDAGELVIDDLVVDAGAVAEKPKHGGDGSTSGSANAGGSGGGNTAGGDVGADAATLSMWKQVQSQARARGVRAGDAPAFDAASSKAQAAVKGKNRAAAASAVAAAKSVLDAVVVDRAFVSEKLARFNRAFDGNDPALKEQLKPLTKDALTKIGKKDWSGANATLNDGFARLAKGR